MPVHVLNQRETILGNYLAEIRDEEVQKDRLRFRTNIGRIGTYLAFEASKYVRGYGLRRVQTPLAEATETVLTKQPVIGTILRAGLGVQEAFLGVFDGADNAFVGAARKEGSTRTHSSKPSVELAYKASPELTDRTLIWTEVMIASGISLAQAHQDLVSTHGRPDQLIVCGVIGAKEGVEYVMDTIKPDELIVAALDQSLSETFYIVPGLGDGGDLQLGPKL